MIEDLVCKWFFMFVMLCFGGVVLVFVGILIIVKCWIEFVEIVGGVFVVVVIVDVMIVLMILIWCWWLLF